MTQEQKNGLTASEVISSREQYGENVITPSEKQSMWKLYFEKFQDPMIRILLFAVFLSFIIAFIHNDFTEVIGVSLAVVLATTIGFWFEWDAARKFDMLNTLADDTTVKVRREGEVKEISKRDIVVGDIVLLESGEEIPADGVLLHSIGLTVNESTLTGEPMIAKSEDEREFSAEATYPTNMLLRGTTVLEGSCEMEVKVVGDATEMGKVTRLATKPSEEKTPLTLQLDRLAHLISVIGTVFSVSLFIILYLKGLFFTYDYSAGTQFMLVGLLVSIIIACGRLWLNLVADIVALIKKKEEASVYLKFFKWWIFVVLGFMCLSVFMLCGSRYGVDGFNFSTWITLDAAQHILSYFMVAVTLIVVAVPEGLPMSVTLSLALNMRRMLKTNNLVRKMHASETMGAITVICTDKTGTLTQNQMRVSKSFFYMMKAQGDDESALSVIQEAIAVNSTAHLSRVDGVVKTIGNPTEASLLLWLSDKNLDYVGVRLANKVLDQISFSTKTKFMATMVLSESHKGDKVLYIKGAPEIILSKCTHINIAGEVKGIGSYLDDINTTLLEQQGRAQRTIAFAYAKVDDELRCEDVIEKEQLILMGVVAISDPVRSEVPQAVSEMASAGVDVKIVTGDTSATAKEIARQIGVWDDTVDTDINHITGVDFEAETDAALLERVQGLKIISRARPADKQRLVSLLQQKGEVVAVTGDGTNDAPALNFAHVGLSMGSGTSVAKEASDITLIDDSFNSVATAVMWGRSLYKNIQRFLFFQLTINAIALTVVLIGSVVGTEIPLTITQMLWVNLIMDTFAAAALASLPPSKEVMRDKPRAKGDFIITREMSKDIFSMAVFQMIILMVLLYFVQHNFDFKYGMTLFFTSFVMLQFWNMFNAKAFLSGGSSAFASWSFKSGFAIVALIIFIGQVLIVSFGGEVFRVVPITLEHWVLITVFSSFVLVVGELSRYVKRLKLKN